MSLTDAREQLLNAALRVYATSGIRGATTRRIAQEAGVNEVTLFRHFGSKDALIHEALAWSAARESRTVLPDEPVNPEAELLEFCAEQHRCLTASRALIRTCMGEFEEHPEAAHVACKGPARVADELQRYLKRLRQKGLASGEWSSRAAAAMLMGTLFADAMGRDCIPDGYPSEQDAIDQYVCLFLRAIGADGLDAAGGSRTAAEE